MTNEIEAYLDNLSESDVRKLARSCVEGLVGTEQVAFYSEPDAPEFLYWEATGDDLIGDLR